MTNAGKSVKGIKSVWAKDMSVEGDVNSRLKGNRANVKITFEVK